jgi:hypothetical protein
MLTDARVPGSAIARNQRICEKTGRAGLLLHGNFAILAFRSSAYETLVKIQPVVKFNCERK